MRRAMKRHLSKSQHGAGGCATADEDLPLSAQSIKEEEMRLPLFLHADGLETPGTATTILRVPASLFLLIGQLRALLFLAGGVWLWTLVYVASPAVAADAAAATLEREVHDLVKTHRQAMGLRPLAHNEEIATQARRHSQAMARGRGDVDHHGMEERRAALVRSLRFTAFAENVAANTAAESQTAEAAVQGWLKSPGHRRNIEGDFTLTGIGIARSATGFFFTQIFLTTPDTKSPRTTGHRPPERSAVAEPHD